jgi:hypothetical protein
MASTEEEVMRICWFNDNRLGLVEGDRVRHASRTLDKLPKPD